MSEMTLGESNFGQNSSLPFSKANTALIRYVFGTTGQPNNHVSLLLKDEYIWGNPLVQLREKSEKLQVSVTY